MQMRIPGLVLAASSLALTGCPNAELAPLEPCTVSGVVREVTQNAVDKVDVLFVVDNSRSMAQEQAQLAEQLPRMVEILASGDLDGDGMQDFPPVKDMHLGVVSTDMGAAGQDPNNTNGCANPGDDGILQGTVANTPACAGVSVAGNYLTFTQDQDPVALGATFACITQLGIDGCGQEQQLDAMLKAVTPQTATDPRFYGGSTGNGDGNPGDPGGPNATFLRQDAVLAVIMVTDEDDCSVPDQNGGVLAPPSVGPFATTPVNLRCGVHADLLYPPERYYNGLIALKPQNPELVIFAAITGIPVALEGMGAEAILADPAMQFVPEPDLTTSTATPRPSCRFGDPADPQLAYPPRRIVQTAAQFGANGTVQSICQESFSGALENIIKKISDQLRGACLPRALVRNNEGIVSCDIVELVFDPMGAGEGLCTTGPAGRTADGVSMIEDAMGIEQRFQRCKINQVAVASDTSGCAANPNACLSMSATSEIPELEGWYYDDFSDEVLTTCMSQPQRITFTGNAAPRQGSTVRFECLQPVLDFPAFPKGREAAGLPCDGNAGVCADANTEEFTLTCEARSNTCQIQCEQQVNCPNGWQCADVGEARLCINPTCPAIEN